MVAPTAHKFLTPDQSRAVTCAAHLSVLPSRGYRGGRGGAVEERPQYVRYHFAVRWTEESLWSGPVSHLGYCDGFLLHPHL